MSDEARLLDVASAIVDGSAIDWELLERQSPDPDDRMVIRELRVLAGIAAIAGQPDGGAAPDCRSASYKEAAWGPLRVGDLIGAGSFGAVYRAWDERLERHVALKLLPEGDGLRGADGRALKEGQQLARVRHPSVVTVFGADYHNGRVGLWMELVDGRTLEAIVSDYGPMGAQEATHIGLALCHALAAVHKAGLLHRDVKARNVMREAGGRILLMDFGSSLRIDRSVGAGSLAGTPLYLAPELFEQRPCSPSTDVYSLGVLLFFLVTGRHPVTGATHQDIERAHRRGQRDLLRDVRPDLPSAFVDVVERALSVDPGRRYESAGRFGAALAGIAGTSYQQDAAPRRRWKALVVPAVVAIGLAAMGMLAYLQPTWTGIGSTSPVSGAAAVAPGSVGLTGAAGAAPGSAGAEGAYTVEAIFHAVRNGQRVPLRARERITAGDNLYVTLRTSVPAFVYVVSQDDRGESYLLFPLRAHDVTNPVAAGREIRLPGTKAGEEVFWQVTSAGGREHFLLFVSPERLTAFEQLTAALPQPEFGRPIVSPPLSGGAVGLLRGIGGLATAGERPAIGGGATDLGLAPLPGGSETAHGLWARQITFDNPAP